MTPSVTPPAASEAQGLPGQSTTKQRIHETPQLAHERNQSSEKETTGHSKDTAGRTDDAGRTHPRVALVGRTTATQRAGQKLPTSAQRNRHGHTHGATAAAKAATHRAQKTAPRDRRKRQRSPDAAHKDRHR